MSELTYEQAVEQIRQEYEKLRTEKIFVDREGPTLIGQAPGQLRPTLDRRWTFCGELTYHTSAHYGVTQRSWHFPTIAEHDRNTWHNMYGLAVLARDTLTGMLGDKQHVTSRGAQPTSGTTEPWQGEAGARYREKLAEQMRAAGAFADFAQRAATLVHEARNSFMGVMNAMCGAVTVEVAYYVAYGGVLRLVKAGADIVQLDKAVAALGTSKLIQIATTEQAFKTAVNQYDGNVTNHVGFLHQLMARVPSLTKWPDSPALLPRPVTGADGQVRVEVPPPG